MREDQSVSEMATEALARQAAALAPFGLGPVVQEIAPPIRALPARRARSAGTSSGSAPGVRPFRGGPRSGPLRARRRTPGRCRGGSAARRPSLSSTCESLSRTWLSCARLRWRNGKRRGFVEGACAPGGLHGAQGPEEPVLAEAPYVGHVAVLHARLAASPPSPRGRRPVPDEGHPRDPPPDGRA
jgi:hypothetical protein